MNTEHNRYMPIPSHPEHYRFERALVVIKPDGVQRSLIGDVIARYERVGLKMVAMRMLIPNEALVRAHYQLDPEWIRKVGEKLLNSAKERGVELDSQDPLEHGERILLRLVRYMTSGPVVAMVWQGAHAVDVIRKITGGTEPRTSDVGTVRGDFMLDSYTMANADERSVRNIVHASGTVEEANAEIGLWFTEKELLQYRLVQEEILYDVNLDGLLE
jgi:nucleoside-diphosphate kinase